MSDWLTLRDVAKRTRYDLNYLRIHWSKMGIPMQRIDHFGGTSVLVIEPEALEKWWAEYRERPMVRGKFRARFPSIELPESLGERNTNLGERNTNLGERDTPTHSQEAA